tara:strand:+ start:256 stop:675 length:420 start_codon:yes stop_codon:yes gene_type:complete
MDKIIAILPTVELVTNLTEVIYESDIPEVSYVQLAKVVLVGALSFNGTNWLKLSELVYCTLKVLGDEAGYMSCDGDKLCDMPKLNEDMVRLSHKLYRTLINLEVDKYNTSPYCDLPHITLMDISKQGDMVVEIYQGEGI